MSKGCGAVNNAPSESVSLPGGPPQLTAPCGSGRHLTDSVVCTTVVKLRRKGLLKYSFSDTLLCSTLLISESCFDGVFERFSSGFAIDFSSELERSEILCEAVF